MAEKSVRTRIMKALADGGEATHHDIAEELGIVPKVASAHLCDLRKCGSVLVVKRVSYAGIGRPCNLWKLAGPKDKSTQSEETA